MREWFKTKGNKHELNIPHNPQQSGTSERQNRSIVEARAIMAQFPIPILYNKDAITTGEPWRFSRCNRQATCSKHF